MRSFRGSFSALAGCGLLVAVAGPARAASFAPATVANLVADIGTANGNAESDTIDLGGQTFTLTVANNVVNGSNGLPSITEAGTVLTIRNGTIAAGGAFRILHVAAGATLVLEDVTLSGGSAGLFAGGAVYNAGTLTATGCTFSGNASDEPGGAIYNAGTVTAIRNCTFSGNSAYVGGGLHNDGTVASLTNSTFAQNAAGYQGGGISNGQGGTISSLVSCIIATNTGGDGPPELADGGTTTAASYNLVGTNDGHTITDGVNGNLVGTSATPLEPLLSPLADNGGPTRTHGLITGSPAIDAGSNPLALAFDQRGTGFARTSGAGTDIGAFEVQVGADLSVTKSDSPDPVTAGTNLVWTITVANAGPDAAATVSLTDTLPAGTTFVALSSPAGWSCTTPAVGAGGTVTCSIASLPAGNAVFTLTAFVGAGIPAGTVLSNTATVTSATTDTNPGNESDTETTTVAAVADLSVTKTDSPDPVTAGTNLVWTITVANAGPSAAATVSLTDTLPAGTTFVSLSSPAGWSCTTPAVGAGGTVTCSIASLPAAGNAVFTLTALVGAGVPAGTVLSNTAAVSSRATDPNPGNDSDTETTTVAAVADLSVTKTDGVTTVNAGAATTYTIVVANAGPSAVTGAAFTDPFPAALTCTTTSVAAGGATGNTPAGAGSLSDTLSLPPGSSVTYTASCTLSLTAFGTVSNTATVAVPAGVTDPNRLNDSATDTDAIQTGAALSATKSVTGAFAPNGTVTYTIVLSNTGLGPQADAPGDELVDVLPATLALVGATASSGTAVADVPTRTVRWNGSIGVGGSVTVTITATVLFSAVGTTVSNQGSLSYDGNGDGANDASTLTDDPGLPGLQDPTDFAVALAPAVIPVHGPFGTILLALLVAAAGLAARPR